MHAFLSNGATVGIGDVLAWVLVAFFLASGLMNIRPPEPIRKSYSRWGYPQWFHYVTAAAEVTGALLLLWEVTRVAGALLLAAVMAAAIATLFKHREAAHAVPAGIAMALCVACASISVQG